MATMSSIRFNKGPFLEQPEMNSNPNYTYNNYKLQNSMNMMQGNGTITSQEKYYSNLYTINQNPMFFSFKVRSGKLRWKEIMKLDIDSMIKTNDISTLESHLENLIFSTVDENDVEIITETTTVKLIKIFQHVLEYLLHTQIRLENENKMVDSNYSQLLNESIFKENMLKENKTLISTLKKDKKEKESILNTYKCIIEEYKNGGFANTINYNTQKRIKISASVNPQSFNEKNHYFFCKYCSGKKFSNEENLNNHYQRRHTNQNNNETIIKKDKDIDISDLRQSKRDYVKNLEGQVEELKHLFQNFMKNNFQNESLTKLAESQKVLENKLGEVNYDKEKMVNLMEENFKKTLIEIKEFVKSNVANNSFIKNEDPYSNNESLVKQKEGIDTIKNNINQMNSMISEIKKNQNEKIQNVYEQINNMKSTISSEIKDLKDTNLLKDSNKKIGFGNSQSFNENNFNRFKGESVEITNAFSISNLPENLNNNKKGTVNNNIKVVKPYFNAGPLESDNSEDEKPSNNFDLRKNESVKISQENKNNVFQNENKEINQYKQNINRNKSEQQKIESNRSVIEEIRTVSRDFPRERNEAQNRKSVKEEQNDKSKYEMDVISQEKPVDISDIIKEQKMIMKMDESKIKNKSQHEVVMDDFSENVYKNVEDINVQNKNEEKNINFNSNKINKKSEIDIDNNDNETLLKKKNSKIPEVKKNEIQIIDFKTNNLENYVLENENLDELKSKFVTQYEERERLFKMANIDLNALELEKDDFEFYRRVL
jgi:hypothetical protein